MNTSASVNFFEKIRTSAKVTLIPHKNPDGDAIGSSLGLQHFLAGLGVPSTIVVEDAVPYFIRFLPGSENIITYESDPELARKTIEASDLIICMDYSQLLRCGVLEPFVRSSVASLGVIDHHPSPGNEFDFYWHDVTASSTSELVYTFIEAVQPGHMFSKSTATCLYTGLLTDTGCFKYAVRPETFIAASALLKADIPVVSITSRIFDSNPPERIKLLGYTLDKKLVILPEYRTAYIALSYNDLAPFNIRKGDTEGLVNYTLSIEGILFGAFFHEREPGKTKISFRSKGDFAVNEFSGRYFNGGGHKNAAGGQYDQGTDAAVQQFLSVLPQYAQQLNSLII